VSWRVGVSAGFSAAHFHTGADEDCARVHGHNYRVEAVVEAGELEAGMALDFRRLRRLIQEAVKGWDHRLLNEVADFRDRQPTTENIARILYRKLANALEDEAGEPIEVKVWEKDDCWAAYGPGSADA